MNGEREAPTSLPAQLTVTDQTQPDSDAADTQKANPESKDPARSPVQKPTQPASNRDSSIRHATSVRPGNPTRYVKADVLNVRGDSTAEAAVLDKIQRGRVVRVLKQSDDWAYVLYWRYQRGATVPHEGWVHKSFLSEKLVRA